MIERQDPFLAAYERGRRARAAGEPVSACPYRDRRRADGGITWARGWRIAWLRGWRGEPYA